MIWAGLATEPEPGLNMRSMNIIQAKLMGGGSSNNGRIYLRGNRKDYDLWGYLGNEGWDYEGCLRYWKKLEDWEGGADDYHGSGGPVHVITTPDATNASQAFVEAGPQLGFKNPNGMVKSGTLMVINKRVLLHILIRQQLLIISVQALRLCT